MNINHVFRNVVVALVIFFVAFGRGGAADTLGVNDALRTYTEFADGANRGLYDPETGSNGYPDEAYDATMAMVVNWHAMPGDVPNRDGHLRYRQVHPETSDWTLATGETFEFWHRAELIHRVVLTDLEPGSVYEYQVAVRGRSFHFRTMPACLDERPVRLAMTADHQAPEWREAAHANAKRIAEQQPDMFIAAGDFVNCEGEITAENAERWASYLDYLYNADDGYFIYPKEIDGRIFDNLVVPHLGILGNHETGKAHHIRWPACVNTGRAEPGYPRYVAGNWMQLLFHWPYSSEGFYSEFNPDHPNMDPEHVREGFGKGGYGALRFSDYLLLIALDNSQNFEGTPDVGLKDWTGTPITDRWPWFETLHADIRQDEWLHNLLEPEDGAKAGDVYTHIIPMWHRGLFGTVRLNMSLKNRTLMKYWLPVLYRNNVRFIKEGHDHVYTRTVPISITDEQPAHTRIDTVYYEPNTWPLPEGLSQEYRDAFFAVEVLRDNDTDAIVGWAYDGHYATYAPDGFVVQGHGGWAAGRRNPGDRGGGNAGFWFVDPAKGGESFGGAESLHTTTVILTNDSLTFKSYHPDTELPIHKARWDKAADRWYAFDFDTNAWHDYDK